MGNRAFVVFHEKGEVINHGIYLHWNGGPESILGFIETMRERNWKRQDYASARFTAVVSEFFDAEGDDSGHSVGLMSFDPENPDNHPGDDNGLYEVFSLEPLQVLWRGKPLKDSPEPDKTAGIVATLRKTRAARTKDKKAAS